MLFDQGARATGATIIPGGTGASELQAEVIMKLGVTGYVVAPLFMTLIERLEATGHQLPGAWKLRHAFIGGELGDWAAKRRYLEQRYAINTWSCYGTADFGSIGLSGWETPVITFTGIATSKIRDPETGAPVSRGEPGEIVTTLALGWPMIRSRHRRRIQCDRELSGRWRSRIAPLQGRVGAAVKVREIFIYPAHV